MHIGCSAHGLRPFGQAGQRACGRYKTEQHCVTHRGIVRPWDGASLAHMPCTAGATPTAAPATTPSALPLHRRCNGVCMCAHADQLADHSTLPNALITQLLRPLSTHGHRRGCAGARMLTNIGDANNLEGLGDLKKKDQASLHATCTPLDSKCSGDAGRPDQPDRRAVVCMPASRVALAAQAVHASHASHAFCWLPCRTRCTPTLQSTGRRRRAAAAVAAAR